MYVCVCVCMYVCVYIYIQATVHGVTRPCIYIYTHTHTCYTLVVLLSDTFFRAILNRGEEKITKWKCQPFHEESGRGKGPIGSGRYGHLCEDPRAKGPEEPQGDESSHL